MHIWHAENQRYNNPATLGLGGMRDLAMRRRHYFEPACQRLMAFAQRKRFAQRAGELGGYDVSELGRVIYNA